MRMHKKAEFDFQTYIVGILLIVGIMITFSSFAFSMGKAYNMNQAFLDNTTAFKSTYNKLNSIVGAGEPVHEQLTGSGLGDESATSTNYGDMLSIGKRIYDTLSLPSTMLFEAGKTLNIPSEWTTIFLWILIFSMITTLVFMVFQGRGR